MNSQRPDQEQGKVAQLPLAPLMLAGAALFWAGNFAIVLLGERPALYQLVGALLVALGIVLANRRSRIRLTGPAQA